MLITQQIETALHDFVQRISAFAPIFEAPAYFGSSPSEQDVLKKVEAATQTWTTRMLNPKKDSTGPVWSVLMFTRTQPAQPMNRGERMIGLDDTGKKPHRQASIYYACAALISVTCVLVSNRPPLIELMEELILTTKGVKGYQVTNIDDPADTMGYQLLSVDRVDYSQAMSSIEFTLTIDGYIAEPSPDEIAKGIDLINTIYHEV